MEITGKIIVALEARGGVSARTGSSWKSQDFVVETHEQYPRKCVFSVFGEDRLKEFNIQVGDEVTVSFDIDAHEYNGRWFNNIRAWRVVRVDPNTVGTPDAAGMGTVPPPTAVPFPEAAPAAPAPTAAPAAAGTQDDLPF